MGDCQTLSYKMVCPAVQNDMHLNAMKDMVWIYIYIYGYNMGYYVVWSVKHVSDLLASENRASIGGRTPSFCSTLI